MTYIEVMIGVAILVLQVGIILHVVLTKHQENDQATMWLLMVTLLPVLGVVIYLLFGVSRLRCIDQSFKEVLEEFRELDETEPAAKQFRQLNEFRPPVEVLNNRFNRRLNRIFPRRPALDGNEIELLRDGTEAYPRMLEDISRAKHCIRLESFIFLGDRSGRAFLRQLRSKAAEGVDVKILYDSFGSFKLQFSHVFHSYMRKRKPNFSMIAFSPINLFAPWKFQLRNHRKVLIIDGKIVYSGGINISEENDRRVAQISEKNRIHDLHCRITGPAVAMYTHSFFLDWAYTLRRRKAKAATVDHDFPMLKSRGNTVMRVVDSGPGAYYKGSERLFHTAADAAETSLVILTPYFVPPSGSYSQALIMAAARGVDVRLVVPAQGNHRFVDFASRSFYRTLLEGGVRIFLRRGVFSHIKALLVDNEWGFMGSSNCDSRSFRLNFELDFCFEGGSFTADLVRQVNEELEDSDELTLEELDKISFAREFAQNICALFSPIL